MDTLDQDQLSPLPNREMAATSSVQVPLDEPDSEIPKDSSTPPEPDEPSAAETTATSQGYGYWPFYLFFTFILLHTDSETAAPIITVSLIEQAQSGQHR